VIIIVKMEGIDSLKGRIANLLTTTIAVGDHRRLLPIPLSQKQWQWTCNLSASERISAPMVHPTEQKRKRDLFLSDGKHGTVTQTVLVKTITVSVCDHLFLEYVLSSSRMARRLHRPVEGPSDDEIF
jgi:hypothetical protein